MRYDYVIIGGGIVGLASALALTEREMGARIALLEKESVIGRHQTSHNSGVIHSGIYYKPGSLKAELCREGAEATKAFCRANGVPFETRGKLLVATNALEAERMVGLQARARENGVACELLDAAGLVAREPAVTGLGALLIPVEGIVSYQDVAAAMACLLRERGVDIRTDTEVIRIVEEETAVRIATKGGNLVAGRLIACAGLQSDRLARSAGLKIGHRIVPFRGEYYVLPPSRTGLVKHLIYPVPDPDLPFLGIHLTPMIDGSITVGPNAVLGFAREGYPKGSVRLEDIADMASFPGFWRVIGTHWRSGMNEFAGSLSRSRYLAECRKYCPSLTLDDLRTPTAGIRAQAVLQDGTLVHDFLFIATERMLHVCNAPSPAATSAIPIGRRIVDRLLATSNLDAATVASPS